MATRISRALIGLALLSSLLGDAGARAQENADPLGELPAWFVLPNQQRPIAADPGGYLFHGVHPGSSDGWEDDFGEQEIEAYEDAVDRKVAWVYFSNNWFKDRSFPTSTAKIIRARGALPFIRLMLRSDVPEDNCEDNLASHEVKFTLEEINKGTFDADLHRWGERAADFGSPVIVEWGTEVNGCWFHWNGWWNGGSGLGPARFRQAYRRIVSRVRAGIECAGGPDNITWVFHVDAWDHPPEEAEPTKLIAPWNRFENYYPGDDVVDWLGISHYGAEKCSDAVEADSLATALNQAIPRLEALAPEKPIFLLEFGIDRHHKNALEWIEKALATALTDSRLSGFAWWNELSQEKQGCAQKPDMQVQSFGEVMKQLFRDQLSQSDKILPVSKPED